MRHLALHPSHPERVCWGCDHYCAAGDLACGNGTIRTLHPAELFGDDWAEWFDAHEQPRGIQRGRSAAADSDKEGEGARCRPDRDPGRLTIEDSSEARARMR